MTYDELKNIYKALLVDNEGLRLENEKLSRYALAARDAYVSAKMADMRDGVGDLHSELNRVTQELDQLQNALDEANDELSRILTGK